MPTETRLDPDAEARNLREALIRPSTWRDEDRSFEVVWTTGAAVARFDWWDGEYFDETLSVDPSAVRLERLQAGGPVLLDHRASTEGLAGSIEPGSVRLENGKGFARVRLAATPDMESTVSKVRDGHLKSVSVGYIVHTYQRTEEPGRRTVMHAIDWEPTEISLTPVPADAGAQVRTRSDTMPQIIENQVDPENQDPPRRSRQGNNPRRQPVTEARILQVCSRADAPRDFERQLLEDHEERPMTEAELTDAIGELISQRRNSEPVRSGYAPTGPSGQLGQMRSAFADVIYSRLSGEAMPETARDYAGASIVDMARELLEQSGERVRWLRPTAVIDQVLRAGNHTTSDFTGLLNDAGTRYLSAAFRAAESPLKRLAKRRDYKDFRRRYGYRLDGSPELSLTGENAEFKHGTLTESKASSQCHTYGRVFAITRQALVNDDLGAFQAISGSFAGSQADLEADYLAGLILGTGATLDDDNTVLFHADHGNVAGSGGAIDETTLSAAREAMRNQMRPDSNGYLNVVPKYLVVGSAKETEAQKMLATLAAASSSNVNPFAGQLELIVDPRLIGNSWRLFADPEQFPVLEYGYLEGQDGLYLETRTGFEVDGIQVKARIDMGAGAVDYRGAYMNPGN